MLAEAPEWLKGWASERVASRPEIAGFPQLGPRPPYLPYTGSPVVARAKKALLAPWSVHAEAELQLALNTIPADKYDTWYRVGMALQQLEWDRGDGTSIGFDLWCEWSATCPEKYSQAACEAKWASFGRGSYNRRSFTERTIFLWASERGWTGYSPGNSGERIVRFQQ